jgi:biotin synthase-related radical SAM superfamily protein
MSKVEIKISEDEVYPVYTIYTENLDDYCCVNKALVYEETLKEFFRVEKEYANLQKVLKELYNLSEVKI